MKPGTLAMGYVLAKSGHNYWFEKLDNFSVVEIGSELPVQNILLDGHMIALCRAFDQLPEGGE